RWSISMESVGVGQAASRQVVSVGETDKIKSIAELFERHCVGAAPVADGLGKCIGCSFSRDLVRFELHRWAMNEAYAHGIAFDFKHHKNGTASEQIGCPMDEVADHISTEFQSINEQVTLLTAAKVMFKEHVHHLSIIDEPERPVGIVSTLDLLQELVGSG
ncbi:MAG: CBS domain-containing protein, partial [Mariniblastus sp.]|nr:CBS domain-containing protein [Mariniblastus sp.]